jgi:FkbM family methyltransferase
MAAGPAFPGGEHLVLEACRHGVFLCSRRDMIGTHLATYGEFAEPEVALVSGLVEPGDTVIDVGANIGTLAVPLAKRVGPTGTVLCFEPQRYIYNLLCANLVLNGATNAHAFRLALDDTAGSVVFAEPDYAASGNFAAVSLVDSARGQRTERLFDGAAPARIACHRLDDAVAGLRRLRLIKIDVEGMEAAVLRGAAGLIREFRPILYCEMNRADAADELAATIRELGYDIYWHAFRGFSPDNFRGATTSIGGLYGDVNVACFPHEAGGHPDLPPMRRFADIHRLMPGVIRQRRIERIRGAPAAMLDRWRGGS